MEKQVIGIGIELAKKIRIYLGTCPHDQVKDIVKEFDETAQTINVKEEKAKEAKG